LSVLLFVSCSKPQHSIRVVLNIHHDTVIRDCNYTLEEAVNGSGAPDYLISQLEIINVKYLSFDHKTHIGQLVVNKRISKDLKLAFAYMYEHRFPIGKVIPIVKYNWDDDVSMQANNTYCFCYRDIYYSKHASGMAIDINPYLNPVRWKSGYEYRATIPSGAVYNPAKDGTFTINSPVVHKLKVLGFRWGHSFSQKYDDHHFEK
jgi:D-alanyl-D-alanine carboxypeptidase